MDAAVVAGAQVVFSFHKGIRRHYALALGLTGRRLVVLRSGEASPLVVDAGNKSKYSSVCSLTGGGSRLSLTFHDSKHRHSVGVGVDTVPEADGFDQYPFASQAGPALFALACGLKQWSLEGVVNHLVAIAEASEGRNGLSGTDCLLVDAYRVGLGVQVEEATLLPQERRAWLRALAASANGQHDIALWLCRDLPDGAYPQRNALVIAATQAGSGTVGSRNQLIEAVDVSTSAGETIAHCLAGRSINRSALRDGAAAIGTWIADPIASQKAVDSLKSVNSRPLPLPGVSVLEQFEPYRVASAVLDRSGRAVARLELSAEMIEALPLTVIDDLIDRGLFTGSASQVHLRSARSPNRGYLALRVDPGSATDEQLAGPGGDAERSRRHVVECLAEGAEPSSGPAATMVALRSGRPVSGNEINALPVEWRATARELSEFLTTGDLGLAEQLAVDPTVLPVIAERLAGESQSLPRSGRLADLRARGYLEDALSAVLEARWEDALSSAREVLGSSNREDLRDEALNLLACAQWQLGDDERAINALREALEGEYNASLQANIGVVAENLEPELAAEHLARLASEAPTVKSRYAAVMRGFGLWSRDQDEDDESPLPAPLRDAFRNIAQSDVESGELSNSDFWSLVGVLAFHDSDWLRTNMTAPAGLGVGGRLGASTGGRLARSPRAQMVDFALTRSAAMEGPEKLNEYIEAVGGLNVPDSAWCAERQEEAVAVALRITPMVLTTYTEQAGKLFERIAGVPLRQLDIGAVRRAVNSIRGIIQGSITLLNMVRPWTDDPVKIEMLERLLEFAQGFDNDLAGALP